MKVPDDAPAFEGRRYTGFKDRYGTPIIEGDLVITRERHWRFRRFSSDYGHRLPWWFHRWFVRLGRCKGRVWLGVVVEMDDGVNPKCWTFQSANQAVTIHDYWASELQIVQVPRGCDYTWRYVNALEWNN